jgi:hypothetical protein
MTPDGPGRPRWKIIPLTVPLADADYDAQSPTGLIHRHDGLTEN